MQFSLWLDLKLQGNVEGKNTEFQNQEEERGNDGREEHEEEKQMVSKKRKKMNRKGHDRNNKNMGTCDWSWFPQEGGWCLPWG